MKMLFSNLACGPFPLKLPYVIAINVPINYFFAPRFLMPSPLAFTGAGDCFVLFVAVRSNFSSLKFKKRGCTVWCKMSRDLNRFGQIDCLSECHKFADMV